MRTSSRARGRAELPQDEGDAGRRADHEAQHDDVGAPALALAVGDPGHQAEQRGAQESEAQPVEGRDALRDGPRRHEHQPHHRGDQAERQRDEEDVTPGEILDHQAAQGRADGRREHDAEAKDAHRHAAPLGGKDGEDRGHHQRLGDAGAEALQDAGEDQAVLGRRRAAQQGAHREEEQRAHEGAALAQNAGQPGVDQHARRSWSPCRPTTSTAPGPGRCRRRPSRRAPPR